MVSRVGVEHELGKRAVQAGQAALEQREAGASNLGSGGEIELAELLADIGVILDFKIERTRRTPALDFNVAGFIAANRHGIIGDIRQGCEDRVELFQQFAKPGLGSLQLVAQRTHLRHDF